MRHRHLLLVLLVAAIARALHLAEVQSDVLHRVNVGDERIYADWAARIAGGAWSSGDGTGPGLYHAPGYAWFLGGLRSVFGMGPWVWQLAHAILGIGTALLIALATTRAFDKVTGTVAGAGYGLFAPAIFYESAIGKTALAQCLIAAGVLALVIGRDRGRDGRSSIVPCLVFGVLIGAAALVQELTLILLPLAWFAVSAARTQIETPSVAAQPLLTARLAAVGLALAGFVAAQAPLLLRNSAADEPLLQRTVNSGQNLWIGSGAGADGFYRPIRSGRGEPGTERDDARREAERATGKKLPPSEVSRWWRSRALDDMTNAPAATAGLLGRKFARAFAAEEWMDSRAFRAHRERSTILDLLGVTWHFGVVAALALASVIRRRRDLASIGPYLGGILALAAGLALFLIYGRLRLSLAVFALPLAADSLVAIVRAFGGRGAFGAWVFVIPLGIGLSLLPNEDNIRPIATTWTNAAAAARRAGNPERAMALAREAADEYPNSPDAQLLFGSLSLDAGDRATGERALRRAASLEPAFGFRANLRVAEFTAQKDPDATRVALVKATNFPTGVAEELSRAAILWRHLGELDVAGDLYEKALQLDPGDAIAHTNFGYLQTLRGQPQASLQHYQRAMALDPNATRAILNMAWLRTSSFSDTVRDLGAVEPLLDRARTVLGTEDAEVLDVTAAAQAEAGDFESAVRTAQRAAAAARSAGRPGYAQDISSRIDLFLKKEVFRQRDTRRPGTGARQGPR